MTSLYSLIFLFLFLYSFLFFMQNTGEMVNSIQGRTTKKPMRVGEKNTQRGRWQRTWFPQLLGYCTFVFSSPIASLHPSFHFAVYDARAIILQPGGYPADTWAPPWSPHGSRAPFVPSQHLPATSHSFQATSSPLYNSQAQQRASGSRCTPLVLFPQALGSFGALVCSLSCTKCSQKTRSALKKHKVLPKNFRAHEVLLKNTKCSRKTQSAPIKLLGSRSAPEKLEVLPKKCSQESKVPKCSKGTQIIPKNQMKLPRIKLLSSSQKSNCSIPFVEIELLYYSMKSNLFSQNQFLGSKSFSQDE